MTPMPINEILLVKQMFIGFGAAKFLLYAVDVVIKFLR